MQLAAGLVESTAEKAKESAEALISQGVEAGSKGPEALTEQVQEIAEDLIEQGRTNRELLVGLVRTEVERTVGRMGFVREEELAAVRRHVERLERELNQRGDQAADAARLGVSVAASAVPATTQAAAKATDTALKASKAAAGTARAAARSATAATAAATKQTPKPPAPSHSAASAAPAKQAPAKRAAAKKTAAKKTTKAKRAGA
jgi:polyhydroxyalkanoate synthesis regulator phasin